MCQFKQSFNNFFSTVHDKKCSAVYEDKCTTELVEECHSEIKEPTRFTLIYMFYPAGEVVKTCEKVPRTVNKQYIVHLSILFFKYPILHIFMYYCPFHHHNA